MPTAERKTANRETKNVLFFLKLINTEVRKQEIQREIRKLAGKLLAKKDGFTDRTGLLD